MKPIPCFRCGAPVAHGVNDLLSKLASGSVSATKAYYHHGGAMDEGAACGSVLRPGAAKDRADYLPFRSAVKKATDVALTAEGYVRVLHVPAPVKAGGAEEAAAKAESARIQSQMNVKVPVGTSLAETCIFVRLPSGEWADRATVATLTAPTAPVGVPSPSASPAPTAPAPIPAPPAPPAPMAPPPPPPPPAPAPVHVATANGVVTVSMADARVMLADGRAYSVFVNGAWGTTLP